MAAHAFRNLKVHKSESHRYYFRFLLLTVHLIEPGHTPRGVLHNSVRSVPFLVPYSPAQIGQPIGSNHKHCEIDAQFSSWSTKRVDSRSCCNI